MCASRPRRVFSSSPTTGEEEHAEADETKRAPHLVEEIAEVEPGDGSAEEDGAEIHESSTRLSHSPPDEEDAERRDESMRGKAGLRVGPGGMDISVIEMLDQDPVAPRQGNHKADGGEYGHGGFAYAEERE